MADLLRSPFSWLCGWSFDSALQCRWTYANATICTRLVSCPVLSCTVLYYTTLHPPRELSCELRPVRPAVRAHISPYLPCELRSVRPAVRAQMIRPVAVCCLVSAREPVDRSERVWSVRVRARPPHARVCVRLTCCLAPRTCPLAGGAGGESERRSERGTSSATAIERSGAPLLRRPIAWSQVEV